MNNALRIAIWQSEYQDSVATALVELARIAKEARAQGADMLVCPEMSLTGYNIGAQKLAGLAQSSTGPWSDAVALISQQCGLSIIYGYPEVNETGGRPYNSVQCINKHGHRLANHRKTRLFGQLDAAQFTAAEQVSPLFELMDHKIGLLICYEVESEALVQQVAKMGADLLIVPTANMIEFDEVQLELIPKFSKSYGLPIAYANAVGVEGQLTYGGLSMFVDRDGFVPFRASREAGLYLAVSSLRTTNVGS
jgi:5-aminopentanamidase